MLWSGSTTALEERNPSSRARRAIVESRRNGEPYEPLSYEARDIEVTHPREDHAVVELRGQHDLSSTHQLRSLLADLVAANELVVVDVSNADFIDSSVLASLFSTDATARRAGRTFVLQVGTALPVHVALKVSGALDYLNCADTREQALAEAHM